MELPVPPPLAVPVAEPVPVVLPAEVPAPSPEVYTQNNGQPVVVYAYADQLSDASPNVVVEDVNGVENVISCDKEAPAPLPIVPPTAVVEDELEAAKAMAEQNLAEEEIPVVEQSNEPCKVETNTEIVETPGETFVHQPGPIYISQPPTKLIINHAPYVVRPSPVVLNQGGKKITKAFTTKFLPSPIQIRPVIVRLVKPIEKKVLVEKPQKPCQPDQSLVIPPVIPPTLCPYGAAVAPVALAAAAPLPLPAAAPIPIAAAAPLELAAADYASLLGAENALLAA